MATVQATATATLTSDLPLCVANRSGYAALQQCLLAQGQVDAAHAVSRLIHQAQTVRPFAGYWLPFTTREAPKVSVERTGSRR